MLAPATAMVCTRTYSGQCLFFSLRSFVERLRYQPLLFFFEIIYLHTLSTFMAISLSDTSKRLLGTYIPSLLCVLYSRYNCIWVKATKSPYQRSLLFGSKHERVHPVCTGFSKYMYLNQFN